MRRISIYGGPGSGKTKLALWLTQELALSGHDTEYVDEWVKRWAYEKREIKGWDQYTIFAGQLEREEFFLRRGVSVVVSDSPLLMQAAYMTGEDGRRFVPLALAAAKLFEEDYPSMNIFLERGDLPYNPLGRWQTKEEALVVDRQVKGVMEKNLHDFYEFNVRDRPTILNECFMRLKCATC